MKVAVVLMVVLMFCGLARAENLFERIELSDGSSVYGCFSSPCTTLLGGLMFGYTFKLLDRQYTQWNYSFLGRSGEKNFVLLFSKEELKADESPKLVKEELHHAYFAPNEVITFDLMRGTLKGKNGCTKEDTIYLKMIELKSNTLKYQMILPNCLKKLKPTPAR